MTTKKWINDKIKKNKTAKKMGKNMKYDDACNNLSFTMRARERLLLFSFASVKEMP